MQLLSSAYQNFHLTWSLSKQAIVWTLEARYIGKADNYTYQGHVYSKELQYGIGPKIGEARISNNNDCQVRSAILGRGDQFLGFMY